MELTEFLVIECEKLEKERSQGCEVKFLFSRVKDSIIHRVEEHWRRNDFEGKDAELGYGCSGA